MIISKIKITFLTIVVALSLLSCTSLAPISTDIVPKDKEIVSTNIKFTQDPPPIHIEVFYPRDVKLNQPVVINRQDLSLVDAISYADSGLSVRVLDSEVDLRVPISVSFEGNLEDYLSYLSRITNYNIAFEDGFIKIRAKIGKTWNLASLSSDSNTKALQSTGLSIGATAGPQTAEVDRTAGLQWQPTIATIKLMLGAEAIVSANQKTGIVYAYANVAKITRVDQFIKQILVGSKKQIHLAVSILDVSVDQAEGRGIDWSLIAEGVNGAIGISGSKVQVIDGAGLISIGTLNQNAPLTQGDISVRFLISLLEKQGKVIVQDQPNITILNGDIGIITTGTEFSFISGVNANTDQSGNIVTTAEIERMQVGITMQVSAKVLSGDKVLINVVPIISSLQRFQNITSGNQTFTTPNITLQKLATQAIVSNGKTMHLGGLIAQKIALASKSLPNHRSIFNQLFGSNQKTLEKREIVILITPTII